MAIKDVTKRALRMAAIALGLYLVLVTVVFFRRGLCFTSRPTWRHLPTGDGIIPIEHAKALARQIPGAHFTAIKSGHNDWSWSDQVKIR